MLPFQAVVFFPLLAKVMDLKELHGLTNPTLVSRVGDSNPTAKAVVRRNAMNQQPAGRLTVEANPTRDGFVSHLLPPLVASARERHPTAVDAAHAAPE
jgi:hypothetical protein